MENEKKCIFLQLSNDNPWNMASEARFKMFFEKDLAKHEKVFLG
jgi:hypothetical protein